MSGIPLVARTQVDVVTLAVNAAYGGAGTLVNNSTDSSLVLLINTSNEVIEYQVGSGTWHRVAVRDAIPLDLNLSTTQLHLRIAQFARAGSAQLEITSRTGDYAAGDDVVELGGEGGSGATAFTDLTDAPGTITAQALLAGNPAGDALVCVPNLSFNPATAQLILNNTTVKTSGDPGCFELKVDLSDAASVSAAQVNTLIGAYWAGDDNYSGTLGLVVSDSTAANAGLTLDVNGPGAATAAEMLVSLSKVGGVFKMTGFDTPATDTTARLTVDAVEYSIAKAIKVKIGSDTFFWPLFGPVAS